MRCWSSGPSDAAIGSYLANSGALFGDKHRNQLTERLAALLYCTATEVATSYRLQEGQKRLAVTCQQTGQVGSRLKGSMLHCLTFPYSSTMVQSLSFSFATANIPQRCTELCGLQRYNPESRPLIRVGIGPPQTQVAKTGLFRSSIDGRQTCVN